MITDPFRFDDTSLPWELIPRKGAGATIKDAGKQADEEVDEK